MSATLSRQPKLAALVRALRGQQDTHHAHLVVGRARPSMSALFQELAQAVFCGCDPACRACAACHHIEQQVHTQVHSVEPAEERPIGIEAIRTLKERLLLCADGTQLVMIPNAQRLTQPAQNALLKTLEEPPRATVFFVGVQKKAEVLPTLRSRSLILRLVPHPQQELATAIASSETLPTEAALLGELLGSEVEQAPRELAPIYQAMQRAFDDGTLSGCLRGAHELSTNRETATWVLGIAEILLRNALRAKYRRNNPVVPRCNVQALQQSIAWARRFRPWNLSGATVTEKVLLSCHRRSV